ncbi:hypothetical protein DJICPGNB_03995 [Escherichia coli]|nr:hypothetical protein DJICPGNB_03995 [Escherichia coli]
MVVGEGLLSAARFALRVVACGNALSLALESNLGRSFSSFPAWAEYLIADSFESSRTFESDGGGGRITQRCALRPSGRCLRPRSLVGARVEPWSKLLILPPLGAIFFTDSFESSGTFESDGGGGRITQRCALRPSGRCLRPRSLAGARVEPWSKLLILPRMGRIFNRGFV